MKYVFGVSSSKDLTDAQWRALWKYLQPTKQSGGEYTPADPLISKEVNNLIASLDSNKAQQNLF
jgi:hypothetical protein